jgi:hypothetical protein
LDHNDVTTDGSKRGESFEKEREIEEDETKSFF